jgi:riboflavin biosynthesis pyrimidine reductase
MVFVRHPNWFERLLRPRFRSEHGSVGGPNLAAAFAKEGLIDEFRFMVTPVVIGRGNPMFRGMLGKMSLELVKVRRFDSGNVLLCYRPKEE